MEQALELLAQPKAGGRGRGAVKREPLKVFEASPVTNNPVQLLAGRYGPYVTDGVTNASLPRGTAPEEVTLEYALNLLKARAERGLAKRPGTAGLPARRPSRKRPLRKKAAKKKTAKKGAKKKAVKRRPRKRRRQRSIGRTVNLLAGGKGNLGFRCLFWAPASPTEGGE